MDAFGASGYSKRASANSRSSQLGGRGGGDGTRRSFRGVVRVSAFSMNRRWLPREVGDAASSRDVGASDFGMRSRSLFSSAAAAAPASASVANQHAASLIESAVAAGSRVGTRRQEHPG